MAASTASVPSKLARPNSHSRPQQTPNQARSGQLLGTLGRSTTSAVIGSSRIASTGTSTGTAKTSASGALPGSSCGTPLGMGNSPEKQATDETRIEHRWYLSVNLRVSSVALAAHHTHQAPTAASNTAKSD